MHWVTVLVKNHDTVTVKKLFSVRFFFYYYKIES